jgi:excisionase family DNA binding protein
MSHGEMFAEPTQNALLTLPEVAAILNVPESWLRRRVAGRTVPFVRLGRYIRFTRDHLARIINEAEEAPLSVAPHGLTRRARPRRVV